MRLPPLLESRPEGVQLTLALGLPALFGGICGILLGISEPVYLVLTILAIAGGFGAGLEHQGARDGALRGFAGGLLFGTFILLLHEISGQEPKADLPDPQGLLVVLTTVFGIALGALGGRSRARRA